MRKPSSSPSPDAAAAGGGGGGSNKSTTTTPCCSKVGLKRGPWTPEEDQILSNFITKEGEGKWRSLPKRAGLLRCGKSCRLRWMNYLRPCVKRGHIAPDEEDLILRLHRLLGNRWSLIAGRIPGRTDNEIKNYWNTHLSKKLVSQGIDPRTHKPLQDMKHDFNSQKGVSNSTSPNPNPNHTHMMIPSDHSTQTAPLFHIKVNHSSSIDPTKTHRILSPDNDDDHHLDFGASFPMNDNNIGFGESSPVSLEEQEVDPNCCTDEVFSSFLNSLINEDMFTCQSKEQHELPNYDGGCSAPPQLNSFTAALAGWGAPPLMFTSSLPSSSSDAIQQSSPSDRSMISLSSMTQIDRT